MIPGAGRKARPTGHYISMLVALLMIPPQGLAQDDFIVINDNGDIAIDTTRHTLSGLKDKYVSSDGADSFTWSVQDRYERGWESWKGLREEEGEIVYGYDPTYVHPTELIVTVDGCRAQQTDSRNRYVWSVSKDGRPAQGVRIVPRGAVIDLLDRVPLYPCKADIHLPNGAIYDVKMDIFGGSARINVVLGRVRAKDLLIVSIGDSMASGEGNPDGYTWVPALNNHITDWVYRRCHRSKTSGHALAAKAIEEASDKTSVTFLSYACSGGTFNSGILGTYEGQVTGYVVTADGYEPSVKEPLAPQLEAVREALCSVAVAQCESEHMRQPDYLLVSTGVNDLGFADLIENCADDRFPWTIDNPLSEGCNSYIQWEASYRELREYRENFQRFKEAMLQKPAGIRPSNGVFISTYPVELFSSITEESNGCGALRGIVYDEARFLESIGQNLNSAIRSESVLGSENLDYRRFYSVGGIARSFLGHGYCADATFFTAWHDGSNMMLHPTKYGHEAIRDRYLEAMEGTRASRIPTHELVVTVDRLAIDNQSPEWTLGADLLLEKLEASTKDHLPEYSFQRAGSTNGHIARTTATPAAPVTLTIPVAPADSKVRLLMAGRARREIGMRRMPLDNDDEPGPVTDNEISSFFASLDLSYSDVTELATRWFFRQRTVNLSAPLSDDGSADTEASVRVRLCAQRVQEPTPTGVTPPRRPCSHALGPARQ